ncbi:MAG TPA: monovalent cation/H+ antiporter complex subunit F [Nocardioidaceae bacterium]|nr:monovalent cation/H+ antiporter complex subunit F [Nocardioidaceae bacterium]
MAAIALAVAVAEIAVGAPLLVRLALGPSVCDRAVALNALSAQATLSLLFYSIFAGRSLYVDVTMWSASFSYLGTLVWARLLERGLL